MREKRVYIVGRICESQSEGITDARVTNQHTKTMWQPHKRKKKWIKDRETAMSLTETNKELIPTCSHNILSTPNPLDCLCEHYTISLQFSELINLSFDLFSSKYSFWLRMITLCLRFRAHVAVMELVSLCNQLRIACLTEVSLVCTVWWSTEWRMICHASA